MLHRDCQHHRHRHLYEPRFSTTGDSFGIHAAHAVGRRRYRSALRRALLRGAQRRAAALWRRISFSLTDLSPGARVYGGIHFCYGGVCRADRTRGHGFWQIHARRPRLWFTGHSLICGRLAGRNLSSQELAGRQRVPKSLDDREVALNRHAHYSWIFRRTKTRNHFFAATRRHNVDLQRRVCGRPRLRHVFLFGLERIELHHR